MKIQKAIDFFMDHNYDIIQWSVVIIFILSFILIYFMIWGPESESSSGEGLDKDQFKGLEESLKKLLQQATVQAGSVVASSNSEGAVVDSNSENNEAMQAELAVKVQEIESLQKQLEDLKNQPASAEGGGAAVDEGAMEELKSKMNQLEAQLQEYEIIEDDIADLSLYKDENAKLKKELEELKAGGVAPEPASEPEAEPASVVAEEPVSTAVEEEEPAEPEPAPVEEPDTEIAENDLVAEFAQAVESAQPEDEGSGSSDDALEASKPVEEPSVPEEVVAVAPESSSSNDDSEDFFSDDILAEFSAAVNEELGEDSAESDGSSDEGSAGEGEAPEEMQAAADSVDPVSEEKVEVSLDVDLDSTNGEEKIPASQDEIDKLMSSAMGAPPAEADASSEGAAEETVAVETSSAESESSTEGESENLIDTDKMLNELSGLESAEATTDASSEDTLNEDMDLDKMAAEASGLEESPKES